MYLGIDGGGTKTAFLLLDASGRILATHQAASSYYIQVGMGNVGHALASGISATLAKAGRSVADVSFAFFGLPAHGEDRAQTVILDQLPAAVMPQGKYLCGNDMVCGWAGSLACGDGISVVAGTGSISYGEYADKSARCGGWGELFGDEGSAYWIACAGLALFSRMSDNRQPKGPLYDIFRSRLSLGEDLDLAAKVYSEWGGERDKIAALAKRVHEAALAGDVDAGEIFARAGRELAALVDATRRSLQIPAGVAVPVSYSGGVFNTGPLVLGSFRTALASLASDYVVRTPRFSPVIGAALYAARRAGAALSEEALGRLEGQASAVSRSE
ncbi:MAG: BadF/BadG/BcrA/BcrD ATPase family protein [Gammaproteobacteria bacterium]